MITIKQNRKAFIPECDRSLGFENDHLVEKRYFEICIPEICGFSFKLDIKNTLDTVDLKKVSEDGEKCVLLWEITSSALGTGGTVSVQLRAFDSGSERVWHSAVMEFSANPSVNAEKQAVGERTLTEFEQLESRVTDGVNSAESYAEKSAEKAKEAEDSAESAKVSALSAQNYSQISLASSENSAEHSELAEAYANQAKSALEETARISLEFDKKSDAVQNFIGETQAHTASSGNPHGVTASQTGAYSKTETDGLLSKKADADDIFICESRTLTDFSRTVGDGAEETVTENCISAGNATTDNPVTIHCAGTTLGCTFSAIGQYYRVTVNGKTVLDNTESYEYAEESFILEPTYMTEDLTVAAAMSSVFVENITVTKNCGEIAAERICAEKADAVHTHALAGKVDLSGVSVTHYNDDGTAALTTFPTYDEENGYYIFSNAAAYSEFSLFDAGDTVELKFEGDVYTVDGKTKFGTYTIPSAELEKPLEVSITGLQGVLKVTVISPKYTDGFMSGEDKAKLDSLEKRIAELAEQIETLSA